MSIENKANVVSQIFREAVVPQPYETKSQGNWIKIGADNLYKQFLVSLYYQSPIHSGIINSKVKYITSGGLEYKGNDLAKWELIKKNGTAKLTLEEVASACCLDNELQNDFYVRCVKNIVSGLWEYDILDSELMRNEEDFVYFYYSENWKGQQSAEKTNFKVYKSIHYRIEEDLECVMYVSAKAKQFLLDNGKLTCNVYPIANYSGAIVSIMADIEMNNFHFAESVNGFTSGTIISLLNGVPEDDVKRKIEAELKDSITDRKKKGGLTVLYAKGKDTEPTVTTLNGNDLDKRYLETQKYIAESTMVAHGVINPTLFGVKVAGQLGNTSELETSFLIFKQNYSVPRGKIITDALQYVNQKLNDLQGEIFYGDYNLAFTPSSDITNATGDALNQMSPLLANKVLSQLTINEIRALAKLPPVDGGDAIPSATSLAPATFSSQDAILNKLMEFGVNCDELTFVKSTKVESFEDLEAQENNFIAQHKIERFASVSKEDKKILGLIDKGINYNDLVKELKQPPIEVTNKLLKLESDGLLEKSSGKLQVSKTGRSELGNTNFEIRYTYEKRPDAPDLVKGGESREFCKTLIEAKKAFLRSEIESINNDQDSNVWLYRGGWYHNPNTDENEVACRHFWKMNIVIK